MAHYMKKGISILLIIALMLGVLPAFEMPASAAAELQSFTPLSDQEATALIGFLADKSKVTEEMKTQGNIYKLLTGALQPGSEEEVEARLAFSTFAISGINKNLENANLKVSVSTDYLMDYLTEKTGGDIDDGLANEVLGDVKDSVKGIMTVVLDASEEAVDNLKFVATSYDTIVNIPARVKEILADIGAGFSTVMLVLGQNKRAQYTYVATKIKNLSTPAYQNPDVANIIDSYNDMANGSNNIFASLSGSNRWNDVENKELLEKFAQTIHDINTGAQGASSAQASVVQVHCPTDVRVTDPEGNKLVEIVADQVLYTADGCLAAVKDSMKLIVLPDQADYRILVTGTGEGTMDYSVQSYNDVGLLREVKFEDLPVAEDTAYSGTIAKEVFAETEEYDLTDEAGNTITANYDSLPEVDVSITDIVVEEELIEGFPKGLIDDVASAMFQMESEIDLTTRDVSIDSGVALFAAIAKYYPAEYSIMSNSGFSYRLIADRQSGEIKKIRFYYGEDINLTDYQKRVKDLNDAIDAVVARTDGMSDFEKALFLHDYIILNCQYDHELIELINAGAVTEEIYSERYTEYSVLVNGTGICGSYALAYRALMNKAGVECIYLSSQQMNHAWNMVKLDGNWYHVDCCWDDPTPDVFGRARRSYFLLTDSQIQALNHYNWAPSNYRATSATYQNMPRNYDTIQKYYNGKWYYIENGDFYSCTAAGAEKKLLFSALAITLEAEKGYVYYASSKAVYRYSLEDERATLVYLLPDSIVPENPNTAYISNLYVDGTTLELYITYQAEDGGYERIRRTRTFDPEKYSRITGLEISEKALALDVFATHTLTAQVLSTGSVEDMVIEWSSSDSAVASVDSSGVVTAENIGTAVITAKFLDFTAQCTISVTGSGQEGSSGSNVTWSLDAQTGIFTLSGNGAMSDYYYERYVPWQEIKSQIKKVVIRDGVTSIGGYAFSNCPNLEEVSIPSSVTVFGKRVFMNCKKLTEVVIPDSVTSTSFGCFNGCSSLERVQLSNQLAAIESSMFQNCISLKEIEIPESVTRIGQYAFESCGFESITIPDPVETIEAQAFFYCTALERIKIGKGVSSISYNFALNCSSLQAIEVDEENLTFSSDEEGVLYNKDQTLLLFYPTGRINQEVAVKSGVKTIGRNAFAHSDFVRLLTLPDSLLTIEKEAFYNMEGLQEVHFGQNLSIIGDSAFASCFALESIALSDSVKELGNYVFKECRGLESATLGGSLEIAGDYLFDWCISLKEIAIPASLSVVPAQMCYNCTALEKVTLHDQLEGINFGAFMYCTSLKEITIPESVTMIDSAAFSYCHSLKEFRIPANTGIDGSGFLSSCEGLEKVIVAEGNPYFSSDESGLLYNKDQTELLLCPMAYKGTCSIPATVATIDFYYAMNCLDLEGIEVDAGNPSYSSVDGVLYNKDQTMLLYYPNNRPDKVFTILATVTDADYDAFDTAPHLETLIYSGSFSTSSFYFSYCEGLKTVVFEESINVADASMMVPNGVKIIVENVNFAPYMYGDFFNPSSEKIKVYAHEGSALFDTETHTEINCINMDAEPHTHDYYLSAYAPADDTADGLSEYTCYCGASYNEANHSFGEVLRLEPGCKDGALYQQCTHCTHQKILEVLSATGEHRYELSFHTEGSCNTPAGDTYICADCSDEKVVPDLLSNGHQYTEEVIAPTCGSKGYTIAVCKACDEAVVYDYTAPAAHQYEERVVEPTCTEQGYTLFSCTCGASYKDDYVDPLPHDYSDGEDWKADLKNHWRFCKECNLPEAESLSAHQYESSKTICDFCGHERKVAAIEVRKLPDKTVYLEAKEPLDLTGAEIDVIYDDDARFSEAIALSMVTGFDNTHVGTQHLTVSYGGKETTFTVEIVEREKRIFGAVSFFGEGEATLRLLKDGEELKSIITEDGNYCFDGIYAGNYTIEVSKADHGMKTLDVVVDEEDLTLNFDLHRMGDTNGNGEVTIADAVLILRIVAETLDVQYIDRSVADVAVDGELTTADAILILRHIMGKVSL